MAGLDFLRNKVGDVLKLPVGDTERENRVLSTNGRFLEAFTNLISKVAEVYLPSPVPKRLPAILAALKPFNAMPLNEELSNLYRKVRSTRNQVLSGRGDSGGRTARA